MGFEGGSVVVRAVELSPGVLSRDLGHRVLLFDPGSDTDHELSGTAALVWRSACEEGTDQALVAQVAALTGEGPERERAIAEAREFVEQLVRLGVLRRVG